MGQGLQRTHGGEVVGAGHALHANRVSDRGDALPVFLTTDDVAGLLRYEGKRRLDAAMKFIRRHGLRRLPRGRRLLVRSADVVAVLEGRQ